MASLAAARLFHLSHGVGTRFFLPPLLHRPKKGYLSSGPVRFIPGSCARIKKTPNGPSLQSSVKKDSISIQHLAQMLGNSASGVKNLDEGLLQEVNFDNETLGASHNSQEIGEFLEFKDNEQLEELSGISDGSKYAIDALSEADGDECIGLRKEVEQVGVELLATRAFTTIELQRKLRSKKYPLHIVESVADNFKSRGLLNDGLYAESFTRSRWLSSTWGPRRIKQALQQKGVNEIDVEKARKQVFEDVDHDGDGQAVQHGMSKLSRDRLFLQASRQWLRSQSTCLENRRARIVRWLQYRGFNWGVISYILKKLESQYPP